MSEASRVSHDALIASGQVDEAENVPRSISSFVIIDDHGEAQLPAEPPSETKTGVTEPTQPELSSSESQVDSGVTAPEATMVCDLGQTLPLGTQKPLEVCNTTSVQSTESIPSLSTQEGGAIKSDDSDESEIDSFRLSYLHPPYASSSSSSSAGSPSHAHLPCGVSSVGSFGTSSLAPTLPAFAPLRLSPTTSESERNTQASTATHRTQPSTLVQIRPDLTSLSPLLQAPPNATPSALEDSHESGPNTIAGVDTTDPTLNSTSAAEVMAHLYAAASGNPIMSQPIRPTPPSRANASTTSSSVSRSRSSFVFVCGADVRLASLPRSQSPVSQPKPGHEQNGAGQLVLARQASEDNLSIPTSAPSIEVVSTMSGIQTTQDRHRRAARFSIHARHLEQLRQLQLYINREAHPNVAKPAYSPSSVERVFLTPRERTIDQNDAKVGNGERPEMSLVRPVDVLPTFTTTRSTWQGVGRYSRRGRRIRLLRRYISALNRPSRDTLGSVADQASQPPSSSPIRSSPSSSSHAATSPALRSGHVRSRDPTVCVEQGSESQSYVLVNASPPSTGGEPRITTQTMPRSFGDEMSPRSLNLPERNPDARSGLIDTATYDYSAISAGEEELPEEHILRAMGRLDSAKRHELERNSLRNASLASLAGSVARPETTTEEPDLRLRGNPMDRRGGLRSRPRARAYLSSRAQLRQDEGDQVDDPCHVSEEKSLEDSPNQQALEDGASQNQGYDTSDYEFDSDTDDYDEFLSEASLETDASFVLVPHRVQRHASHDLDELHHTSTSSLSSWSAITPLALNGADRAAASFSGEAAHFSEADMDLTFTSFTTAVASGSSNTALAHTAADLCNALLYMHGREGRSRYRRMLLSPSGHLRDEKKEATSQLLTDVTQLMEQENAERIQPSRLSRSAPVTSSQNEASSSREIVESCPQSSASVGWLSWPRDVVENAGYKLWDAINTPFGRGLVIGVAIGLVGGFALKLNTSGSSSGSPQFTSTLQVGSITPNTPPATPAPAISLSKPGLNLIMASPLETGCTSGGTRDIPSKPITITPPASLNLQDAFRAVLPPVGSTQPSIDPPPHYRVSLRVRELGSQVAQASTAAFSAALSTVGYYVTKIANYAFDYDREYLEDESYRTRIARLLVQVGLVDPVPQIPQALSSSTSRRPAESTLQLLTRLGSGGYVQLRSSHLFSGQRVYLFAQGRRPD